MKIFINFNIFNFHGFADSKLSYYYSFNNSFIFKLSSSLLPKELLQSPNNYNNKGKTQNLPLDWIIESPPKGAAKLLSIATDKSLPDTIIEIATGRSAHEDIGYDFHK